MSALYVVAWVVGPALAIAAPALVVAFLQAVHGPEPEVGSVRPGWVRR